MKNKARGKVSTYKIFFEIMKNWKQYECLSLGE